MQSGMMRARSPYNRIIGVTERRIMAKATMADVAKVAGVSKQTVSKVINRQGRISRATIERVEAVIEELGYRPNVLARSLATSVSHTMGLVVPTLDNPYFSEIAQGAEQAAWDAKYNLFLCNVFLSAEREEAVLRSLEDKAVDGIIIESPQLAQKRLLALLKRHKAAVVIGREVPPSIAGQIMIDDAAGITLALDHLLSQGRQVIAMLTAPPQFASGRVRKAAFIQRLEAEGLLQDDLVVESDTSSEASFRSTVHLLRRRPDIDALVCFNDIMAGGALKALLYEGARVPADIALVGHDDIPMATLLSPTLTTLRVSKSDIGVNAVRMLLDRLEGRNQNTRIVMQPELVVRESTSRDAEGKAFPAHADPGRHLTPRG